MNEKENTFNILANKRLLITSPLCYFDIHSWSKWNDPQTRAVAGYQTIFETIQEKTCRHCNLRKYKKFK